MSSWLLKIHCLQPIEIKVRKKCNRRKFSTRFITRRGWFAKYNAGLGISRFCCSWMGESNTGKHETNSSAVVALALESLTCGPVPVTQL
jgi:hypothetical protein